MNIAYESKGEIFYKDSNILKDFIKITILILMNMIHPFISILLYIGLIPFSIKGKVESVKTLIISFTVYFLNPGMFKIDTSIVPILRWMIFFICIIVIFKNIKKENINKRWIVLFFTWSFYTLLISLVKSNLPLVSLAKLLIFFIGFIGVNIAIDETKDSYNWGKWILTYLMVIEIISLPLIILPVGYFRNGSGFQGILNQPNAFGIITAVIICTFIYIKSTKKYKEYDIILNLTIVVSIFMLFSSKSRTSMLSMSLGMIIYAIVWIKEVAMKKSINLQTILIILIFMISSSVVLTFNYPSIVESAKALIYKGNSENLLGSSEGVIDKESIAIENSFLIGNGFGVDWYPNQEKSLELSLTHPVEKRNIFLALMSETGLIGTIMFIIVFIQYTGIFIRRSIKYQDCIFVSLLFINFGEMVFFSGNGIGMFVWFILAFYNSELTNTF